MFNGYRNINNEYIYLYLDNNYEFSSDLDTKEKKKLDIINSCNNFIDIHNLKFNDRVYLISNGLVIGYINKYVLDKYRK